MVISIMFIIVGIVALVGLPIAQFPEIVPPEIQIWSTYTGADAQTVEQSVATPIEQQLSGVDNMNYMYSLNANNGSMRLTTSFDIATNPNTDLVLTQIRQSLAEPQLPQDVRNYGVTVQKARSAPLMILSVYSPNESLDARFLANYAYINLVDQLLRVPGVGMATVWGSGMYAIRIWVKPDILAKLEITVPQVIAAVQKQNTVNPAGQIGAEPAPPGQEFTYSVSAQGRLITPEEFGQIVLRANSDGSVVRLNDVARIEMGSQVYTFRGRLNGKPAANLGIYQLPGTNAIETAKGVRRVMEEAKRQFPAGLDYIVGLDTTRAITEGIREIVKTLLVALALVIVVVFIFLQGWRPTLIPTVAVPVSLIGTFAFFPLLGFSINTLSLFGLVLAIGLVVDDAIVVVECVERHIEEGMPPKDAAFKAMEEVSGPGHGYRSGALGGLYPYGVHPRNYGQALPAICGNHCHFSSHLGLQRLESQPRPCRSSAETTERGEGPLGFLLRIIQPLVRTCHNRICGILSGPDPQGCPQPSIPCRNHDPFRRDWKSHPHGISARRGSRVHVCQRFVA